MVGATYSECAGGSRTAVYHWTQQCQVGAFSLPQSFQPVSCICTVYDYVSSYTPCVKGSRTITYALPTGSTCTAMGPAPQTQTVMCECTQDDMGTMYSPCSGGRTRTAIWYWPDPLTCDNTFVPLNQPVSRLPCDKECAPGEHLVFGTPNCGTCNPGQFSIGGGRAWNSWDPLPVEFRTSCTYEQTPHNSCIPWTANGNTINSGSNKGYIYITSSLYMTVQLVKPGSVSVTYQLDAEDPYDDFSIWVDDVMEDEINKSVNEWTTYTFNLSVGYHVIEFMYEKDGSNDIGLDMVQIQSIQVVGTDFHSEECTPCAPGTVQAQPGQTFCTPCGTNTNAPALGSSACTACAGDEYSFPGASQCYKRPVCTEDDYVGLVGACRGDNAAINYGWLQPQLCVDTNSVLPAPGSGPCEPCPAGSGGDRCQPCQAGWASPGNGAACARCLAGHAALPVRTWTWFDSPWPTDFQRSCTGLCGTNLGWRLRHDSLDAGIGGTTFTSSLTATLTLQKGATVTFTYQLSYNDSCLFEFFINDNNYLQRRDALPHAKSYTITEEGEYKLEWRFHKNDPENRRPYATAFIRDITISGLVQAVGGAVCTTCPAGTFAPAGASSCTACPAGSSSASGSASCTPCPTNTYSTAGGLCIPCGVGVFTPAGSSECKYPCTFQIASMLSPIPINYDLSALARNGSYVGPVHDGLQDYYINICSKEGGPTTCLTDDEPQRSFACQKLAAAPKVHFNLGDILGYEQLPGDPSNGLVVRFSGGTEGCGGVKRSLNITMICDPLAIPGFPTVPAGGAEPMHSSCQYRLVWRSLYACPLCTPMDFSYTIGPCVDGHASKTYFWREKVQTCHDGVSLPSNEQIPCNANNQVQCDAGNYADGDSCVQCDQGTYSLGGGDIFYSNAWFGQANQLPPGFSTPSTASPWRATNDSFHSGVVPNTWSTLKAIPNFVKAGYVSFEYKVASHPFYTSDKTSYFQFKIDGGVVLPKETLTNGFVNVTFEIPVIGSHTLEWEFFSYGTSEQPVYVRTITIVGTRRSDVSCSVCGLGNEGAAYAPGDGATSCIECPVNQYTTTVPAVGCEACPANSYRLEWMTQCRAITRQCAEWDAVTTYDACTPSGKTTERMMYSSPVTCLTQTLRDPQQVNCPPCMRGFVRTEQVNMACTACPAGTYPTPNWTPDMSSAPCSKCPAGTAAVRSLHYDRFDSTDGVTLPAGFSTSCAGSCGSNWRPLGNMVDSGVSHYGEVDVYLGATVAIGEGGGSLTFTATLNDIGTTGEGDLTLSLYINGVAAGFLLHSADSEGTNTVSPTIDLPTGTYEVLWVYHQRRNFPGCKATLSDIAFFNTVGGSATSCFVCNAGLYSPMEGTDGCLVAPAGSYTPASNSTGALQVIPCPEGTFSSEPGSASCTPCGANTESSQTSGSTDCKNTCQFLPANSTDVYDISNLEREGGDVYSVPISATSDMFYITPCSKSSRLCQNALNSSVPTYICRDPADPSKFDENAGSIISYHASKETPERGGFLATFTGGTCAATNNPVVSTITFLCAPANGGGYPIAASPFQTESPECHYNFVWYSIAACPVCYVSDFDQVRGACSNGKRSVNYVPNKPCNPASDVSVQPFEESCGVEVGLLYLIGAAVIFVIAVAIIGFCVWRNRRLSHRYTNLLQQNEKNVSMGGFCDNDDDDDAGVATSGAFERSPRRDSRDSNDDDDPRGKGARRSESDDGVPGPASRAVAKGPKPFRTATPTTPPRAPAPAPAAPAPSEATLTAPAGAPVAPLAPPPSAAHAAPADGETASKLAPPPKAAQTRV